MNKVRLTELRGQLIDLLADGQPHRQVDVAELYGSRAVNMLYRLVRSGHATHARRGWYVRSDVPIENVRLPVRQILRNSIYGETIAALTSPRTLTYLAHTLGTSMQGMSVRLKRLEKLGVIEGPSFRPSGRRAMNGLWRRLPPTATGLIPVFEIARFGTDRHPAHEPGVRSDILNIRVIA